MARTVAELRSSPWLIRLPACGVRKLRLVGFPHAGGGASRFHRLFRDLRPEIEVIGIQLPGRENRVRDPVSSNLSHLLDDIVENLAPVLQDDVPFIFFGHSLGALLAFEMVRRFRANRLVAPRALIVSGRTPPHLPLVRPALHGLADDDLLREVAQLEGIPQEIQSLPEMRTLILPPLRADLKLNETYVYSPEPPLSLPILACGGRDDPEAPVETMQEWQVCTCSKFVFKVFEGGHFFLYTNPALFAIELASFLHSVVPARA
jgi:medium-chain acyl-[acyl-carrier-protein] hydrolase